MAIQGMPISSLPDGELQSGDEVVLYRESTGKAYKSDCLDQINEDLASYEIYADSVDDLLSATKNLTDFRTYTFMVGPNLLSTILETSIAAYGKGFIGKQQTVLDGLITRVNSREIYTFRVTISTGAISNVAVYSGTTLGSTSVTTQLTQLNTSLADLEERVAALEQAAGITGKESPQGTEPGPEEDPDPDDDGTAKEEPGIVIPDDGGDDGDPDEGEPDDDGGDDDDKKTAPGPEETGDDGDDGDDDGDDDGTTPSPDPDETV